MDPLSSICFNYGTSRETEKYHGRQPKSLVYKLTYDDIPEWNKHKERVCKVDPRFCL